jgi:hypothetical protein
MAAIDASQYDEIIIESGDGQRTVDMRLGILAIRYFEDLFSPTITVEITVTNTGGVVKGKDGTLQSLYSGLPLRGGERVFIKIAGNSKTNKGIDLKDQPLYVSKISNVIREGQRESFVLKLVSRESIANETTRLSGKYGSSQISDHVAKIIKESLLSDKPVSSDDASNQYSFIGNLKRPFDVITMLASKSIPDTGVPGYFFYETIDGYNFRSIDKLIVEGKSKVKAEYFHQEDQNYEKSTDNRILSYSVSRNNDLLEKLRLGTYASFFAQYDPYLSRFTTVQEGKRTINDFAKKATFLGDDPEVPQLFGSGNFEFDTIPSRIVTSILDVGVLDLTMTVPLNTTLQAGNVIKCNFLKISSNSKEFDRENSGLYMIKELCHHFDGKQSLTSMKLLRDTFGD